MDATGLHGGVYGPRTCARQSLGTHRTAVAAGQAPEKQWPSACSQSRRIDRHPLRSPHRYPLGIPAPGNGMRQRHDLLAPITPMARTGRVARGIRNPARPSPPRRRYRLVAHHRGQRIGPCRFWGQQTGPSPTDRRKRGSKHHILTDAQGIPLAFTLTGANRHDVTQLLPLVEAIPPVRGKPGPPRRRPCLVQGDRGYDSQPHRDALHALGIKSLLAKRNTDHGSGLGRTRWVVERTLAWLHQYRRLRVRYERRADIHEAFLAIGCIMICHNFIQGFC